MKKTISYVFFAISAALFGYILLSGIVYVTRKNSELALNTFFHLVIKHGEPENYVQNEDGSITLRMSWEQNGPFVTCQNGALISYAFPYDVPLEKSGAKKFCEHAS